MNGSCNNFSIIDTSMINAVLIIARVCFVGRFVFNV